MAWLTVHVVIIHQFCKQHMRSVSKAAKIILTRPKTCSVFLRMVLSNFGLGWNKAHPELLVLKRPSSLVNRAAV